MKHGARVLAFIAILAGCGGTEEIAVEEPEQIPPGGTGGGGGGGTAIPATDGGTQGDAQPGDATASGEGGPALGGVNDCTRNTPGVLTVCDKKIGTSIKYMGAIPGGYSEEMVGYLNELSVKWIRGARSFRDGQTTPFDGRTIAEVKADPNLLDWNAVASWVGSSNWYQWAAQNNAIYCPVIIWFRNMQTSTTCTAGEYAFDTTPGSADENRLWLAIFSMAYWANVKNPYNLVSVAFINEPDNCGGNGGTQNTIAGVKRMIQIGQDALSYVNKTLVSPAKDVMIAGPDVLSWYNGKAWLNGVLQDPTTAAAIDRVSFHAYWAEHWWEEISAGAADINGITGKSKKIWLDEWGQWWYEGGYGNPLVVSGMSAVIAQLGLWNIEMASSWQLKESANSTDLQNGLVLRDGSKTGLYFTMKMLGRALLSEKDMLQTSVVNEQGGTVFAWATRDATDLYVIYYNLGDADVDLAVDLRAIAAADGKAVDVWRVGPDTSAGEVADPPNTVSGGAIRMKAQAGAYYVLKVQGAGTG